MTSALNCLGLFAIVSSSILLQGHAYQVANNPLRRAERIDPEGRYLLEWEVDWKVRRIIFNVTVESRNWIGFGLSSDGEPFSGADMVIGGVGLNGKPYFSDRHVLGGSRISILDRKQDWTLHNARESKTHTVLLFSRALDTCDPQDYQITPNQVRLLWAYGRNDNEVGLNPQNSGSLGIHLLDPDYSPEIVRDRSTGTPRLITVNRNEGIPKDTKTWSIQTSRRLTTNDTAYYCQIHKAPKLQRRHHVIGYDIYFPNDVSRDRTHHILVYRCHAPRGATRRQIFEPHLNNPGEHCYSGVRGAGGGGGPIPIALCTEFYLGWAVGGKRFFTPNHVGVAFGDPSEEEYYLFQVHYDNPDRQREVVDVRMDFFYTSQLRPNEGGMMAIHHEVPGLPESILIPPNSRSHRIFGHCSSGCTQRLFPPGGIKISAVQLHAHNSAVGMRLHHFRGERELPWIIYDDNYDNQVQPVRHLRNEVRVMPGDQLTIDCRFTNNDTTTIGGHSTRQEMCMAFIVHYERVKEYSNCMSEIYSPEARNQFLGIGNITWDINIAERIVQTPARFAGMRIGEVSDRFVDWTPERRNQFQRYHLVQTQSGGCHKDAYTRDLTQLSANPPQFSSLVLNTPSDYRGPVSYPFQAVPYVPPGRSCPHRSR